MLCVRRAFVPVTRTIDVEPTCRSLISLNNVRAHDLMVLSVFGEKHAYFAHCRTHKTRIHTQTHSATSIGRASCAFLCDQQQQQQKAGNWTCNPSCFCCVAHAIVLTCPTNQQQAPRHHHPNQHIKRVDRSHSVLVLTCTSASACVRSFVGCLCTT